MKLQDGLNVYDIFAMLIPGTIFLGLSMITLKFAAGIEVIKWKGGLGDATILIIAGYSAGTFLQGIGKITIEPIWLKIRGGQPTATILLLNSNVLSSNLKVKIIKSLTNQYGKLPGNQNDHVLLKSLEDHTYQAYKFVSSKDPITKRFFAEFHAMRGHAVSFFLLIVLTLVGGYIYSELTWDTHGLITGIYLLMQIASLWRMENKSLTYAKNTLIYFLNLNEKDDYDY